MLSARNLRGQVPSAVLRAPLRLFTLTTCPAEHATALLGHISLLYPDSSAEPGVHVHAWSSHLPTASLQALPEAHSIHVLVDADSVLSGHYLADVRMALLLATPPLPRHRARPRLEKPFPTLELEGSRTTGKTSHEQHSTTISTPTRIPALRGSGHSESVRSAHLLLPGTVLERGAPCLIPSQHLCLPEHLQTVVFLK